MNQLGTQALAQHRSHPAHHPPSPPPPPPPPPSHTFFPTTTYARLRTAWLVRSQSVSVAGSLTAAMQPAAPQVLALGGLGCKTLGSGLARAPPPPIPEHDPDHHDPDALCYTTRCTPMLPSPFCFSYTHSPLPLPPFMLLSLESPSQASLQRSGLPMPRRAPQRSPRPQRYTQWAENRRPPCCPLAVPFLY